MIAKHAIKKPAKKSTQNSKTKVLLAEFALGEDSTRQFKRDITNGDALAAEMLAFGNAEGGTIFLGVADDGTTPEISADDVKLRRALEAGRRVERHNTGALR